MGDRNEWRRVLDGEPGREAVPRVPGQSRRPLHTIVSGLIWSAGAVVVCVLVLSVLSVLRSAMDVVMPSGSADVAGVYAAWWMILVWLSMIGVLVGAPIAMMLVALWVALSRVIPTMEASILGVCVGTGVAGLVAALLAYVTLGPSSTPPDAGAGELLAASAMVGVAVWAGLAVPRLLVGRLRPGAFLRPT